MYKSDRGLLFEFMLLGLWLFFHVILSCSFESHLLEFVMEILRQLTVVCSFNGCCVFDCMVGMC